VATLIGMIDGQTPAAGIVERLSRGQEPARAAQIERTVLDALGILYVDGTIEASHERTV
jgi:hypothetical protein